MKPGPKPLPTHLKILHGEKNKNQVNLNEPETEVEFVEPPECVEEDLVAHKEWVRVAWNLYNEGYTTRYSRAALTAYCLAWSRFLKAIDECNKHGAILYSEKKDKAGNVTKTPYMSPWAAERNHAEKEMRSWMAELGMTPSSRSRVISVKPLESGITARDRKA